MKDLKTIRETVNENEFNEYILNKFNEDIEKDAIEIKNTILDTRLNLLNITNKEDADKYKEYLMDNYKLKSFFQVTSLFRTSEYIKNKLEIRQTQTYKYNQTIYNKITLLEKFEEHYKISRFGIDYNNVILEPHQDENNEYHHPIIMDFQNINVLPEISDDYKKAYLLNFSARKSEKYKYDSIYEIQKVYINMIRHISDNIPIIENKQKRIKGTTERKYLHNLDVNQIKHIIQLASLNSPGLSNYKHEQIEKLTKIKPIIKESDELEEDKILEDYLFGKNI